MQEWMLQSLPKPSSFSLPPRLPQAGPVGAQLHLPSPIQHLQALPDPPCGTDPVSILNHVVWMGLALLTAPGWALTGLSH